VVRLLFFSTAIGETDVGAAGLTESAAQKEGFDVVTGTFEGVDKHPGTLPGACKQTVKLIIARESGVVLGGEVVGGLTVGELTNLIGLILQNRMTMNCILNGTCLEFANCNDKPWHVAVFCNSVLCMDRSCNGLLRFHNCFQYIVLACFLPFGDLIGMVLARMISERLMQ